MILQGIGGGIRWYLRRGLKQMIISEYNYKTLLKALTDEKRKLEETDKIKYEGNIAELERTIDWLNDEYINSNEEN